MSKAASLEQSGSKDISQRLLNLDLGGQPPMLVGEYIIWIKKHLEWLEFPRSWTFRSQVNVIVIPVRISGNWCLYQIMRGPTPRWFWYWHTPIWWELMREWSQLRRRMKNFESTRVTAEVAFMYKLQPLLCDFKHRETSVQLYIRDSVGALLLGGCHPALNVSVPCSQQARELHYSNEVTRRLISDRSHLPEELVPCVYYNTVARGLRTPKGTIGKRRGKRKPRIRGTARMRTSSPWNE